MSQVPTDPHYLEDIEKISAAHPLTRLPDPVNVLLDSTLLQVLTIPSIELLPAQLHPCCMNGQWRVQRQWHHKKS